MQSWVHKIVPFYLNCPERRLLLVGQKNDEHPFIVPMQQLGGLWHARLELDAGCYRFRYYVGDHRNIVYLGPAEISGSTSDGMDALITIEPDVAESDHVSPTLLRVYQIQEAIALN